ncbi:DUF2306 domain-containing protein [Salipiger mucosus]|uniref:DUF2306 domain-containing protein n=1 Tax=Salipiger mucosus TaxID=263378 RepID=UPI00036291C3|nr:DUF2306 domain-containing protein [Salipiger mucosus]
MNWQALWNDGAIITIHAFVALIAMGAGAFQLAAPKGTALHKALGYFWVGAMAIVAATSFWIHEFRWFGPFSIIHVLSILVLTTLVYSVSAIRQGRVAAHRNSMIQLYALALLLTGAFTLIPGRTMHTVFFGG